MQNSPYQGFLCPVNELPKYEQSLFFCLLRILESVC